MKILLHRLGLLGDTLGAYSAVPILKKKFGHDIEIDWIVRSGVQSLFTLDPAVKTVYVIKSRKFLRQLWFRVKNKFPIYDLIINLDTAGKAPILKWISAKQKIGFPFQVVSMPPLIHLFTRHQYLCRQLLKISDDGIHEVPVLFGAPYSGIEAKLNLKKPYLVLALATSRTHKHQNYLTHRNWSLASWKHFLRVARKLPFQLVVVGTSADKECIEKEVLIPDEVINAMGKTSVPELITLVRHATAVVTCDTGILHLASCLKTPIFAIMGPSDPLRHGPFPINNTIHTVIRSNISCSPCELTPAHKACKKNRCMQLITPESVCAAIEARLSKNRDIDMAINPIEEQVQASSIGELQ